MFANLSRTASKWLGFYADYATDWWDDITFSQYMILMLLGLALGWVLLKSAVKGPG